jgi:hypothetical protein
MKKQLSIKIRGREKLWSFTILGDPAHLSDWRADGLCIEEIVNRVPESVAARGRLATHVWCRLQDVFNFKNPFSRR